MEAPTKLEKIASSAYYKLGIPAFLTSAGLRALAEEGLVNYSYWQNTGEHWGAAMLLSGFYSHFKKKTSDRLFWATTSGTILSFVEAQQYHNGNGDIQDIIANFGGAFLGAFLPDIIKGSKKLYDTVKEKYSAPVPIEPLHTETEYKKTA